MTPSQKKNLAWAAVAGVLALLIFIDHMKYGRLLPDEWYCRLGAGAWVTQQQVSGYQSGQVCVGPGNCYFGSTGRPNAWTTVTWCRHGSFWDGIVGRTPLY